MFFVQAPNCRPFIDEEGALFACSYYLELFFRQDPETGSSDTDEGPGKRRLFKVQVESAVKVAGEFRDMGLRIGVNV